MIVLCCPVNLWESTRVALEQYAPETIIVPLTIENYEGYGHEVFGRWGQDDLLLVEQDIVIREGVIPQFELCEQLWCLFPYPYPGGYMMETGTGCTRFRRDFQNLVTVPLISKQGGYCNRCKGSGYKCWVHIDGRINDAAATLGIKPHLHYPPVGHRVDSR